jgi:hypothetical protein
MHALTVLELTVWVNNWHYLSGEQSEGKRMRVKTKRDDVQRLIHSTADMLFTTLATSCPRFTVVVLDDYGPKSPGTLSFLKSKQIGLSDQTTVVGTPVELSMIKHYEPCSDILEPDDFIFA